MLEQEALSFLSRAAILFLTLVAILDYLRQRGKIRRDIALMLFSIAASIITSQINNMLGTPNPLVSLIGSLLLITQAYQMLRLVTYFQVVPRIWRSTAFLLMLLSAVINLLYGTDIPILGIVLIVAYFVIFNGYAVVAFIKGARTKKGISQKRLEFVAIGTAFFALTLLLIGLRAISPALNASIMSFVFISFLISVIMLYLGLNPFRWLRQSWQLRELRDFLNKFSTIRDKQLVYQLICEVAVEVTGAKKAEIVIWDSEKQIWQFLNSQTQLAGSVLATGNLAAFWQMNQACQIKAFNLHASEMEVLGLVSSDLLYVLPFFRQNDKKLKLLVYLEHGSLFPEDDLSLLQILLEQAGLNLDNIDLFSELAQQAAKLEATVEERTQALTRQNQSLSLLQQVIIAANETDSVKEPLAKSLQIIADALDFPIAHIYNPQEIVPLLTMQSLIWYLQDESKYEAFCRTIDKSDFREQLGLLTKVILAGQVVCITQLSQNKQFKEVNIAANLSLETGIFVPIMIKQQCVAALEFFSEQAIHIDEHLQDLLRNVASQLGRVIERKLSEEAMLKLNQELEKRVDERTAHLKAVNHELEAFSYSVSHDLRAPLRTIDGFSQILLEDYYEELDAEAQEYLDIIRAESQRMGQLIDDLIKLSRFTRDDLVQKEFNLSAMAEEIASGLQQNEVNRHVDFQIEPNLMVCADASLLRVALNNLLGNAWKYSRHNSETVIELKSGIDNGERFYFVRDNGAGFDMTYVHKLFGAFQRLHSMTEFEGSGIGLATVQRIIHRHGGKIWAEGRLNEGACFYFTLGKQPCK